MRANEQKQRQQAFLAAYRNCMSVRRACELAGIGRTTVYGWCERFPEFKQAFDAATEDVNDSIDDEIMRRAKDGWDEPAISAGRLVRDSDGEPLMIKRYSDTLMTMLAKSRMQKYREKQQVEHSGAIDISNARESLLLKLQNMAQQESKQE